MPADRTIAINQALFLRPASAAEGQLLGRSLGFVDDWLPKVQRMVAGFGARPEGVPCPGAVFARPLDKRHVAVVQVADQPDGSLGFHFLAVPRDYYTGWIGDPFLFAERHPAPWHLRGELPSLSVEPEPAPKRTVADVQRVLQRVKAHALKEDEEGITDLARTASSETAIQSNPDADEDDRRIRDAESPALLGGVQLLVDGGKLMIVRPAPDAGFVRALWALLPHVNRGELWPASFAFSTELGFDVVVVPRVAIEQPPGYSNEDQAADYPAGKYERDLQTAAEAGDQAWLDSLFARRSRSQVWKTAIALLIGLSIVVAFVPRGPWPVSDQPMRAAGAAQIIGIGDPLTAATMIRGVDPIWRRPKE